MSAIITVENISKKYIIRHQMQERYVALRDILSNKAKGAFKMLWHPLSGFDPSDPGREEFWALKEINFEVMQGDRLGIIGHNGAGKSTILKILSRITEPTIGRICIKGRVASLLEVGTGFHPELTGRENIFLNGAILGMTRKEIKKKFDEIVDFAEVEKFLDTPVKRYSSGMYVRLAFSVASHLEPEILVVDEVLAVGDAAFQKKCLGKMDDVSKEGRTVLFVSHNMGAVQSLCTRAILLENGTLKKEGDVYSVVRYYLAGENTGEDTVWLASRHGARSKNDILTPLRLALLDRNGNPLPSTVRRDEEVYVELEFDLHQQDNALTIGISVFDQRGFHLFRSLHTDTYESLESKLRVGRNRIRMRMPMEILNEGDYSVVLDGGLQKIQWLYHHDRSDISVKFSVSGGISRSPFWLHGRNGLLAPIIHWENIKLKES
ncbi:MAG: ABC transporter ATP-binding protein [Candidatus Hodarchaeota archaeon]